MVKRLMMQTSGESRNARFEERNISAWDTSSVTTMSDMFLGAAAFNQPLAAWDTASVTNM
jgi:surface protein